MQNNWRGADYLACHKSFTNRKTGKSYLLYTLSIESATKMKKKIFLSLLFIILFSLPAILPLLHPGFFSTDDGEWMIIRLSAFYPAFADGQFPVRFMERLNFGYGYPVAEFLYPGIMY